MHMILEFMSVEEAAERDEPMRLRVVAESYESTLVGALEEMLREVKSLQTCSKVLNQLLNELLTDADSAESMWDNLSDNEQEQVCVDRDDVIDRIIKLLREERNAREE